MIIQHFISPFTLSEVLMCPILNMLAWIMYRFFNSVCFFVLPCIRRSIFYVDLQFEAIMNVSWSTVSSWRRSATFQLVHWCVGINNEWFTNAQHMSTENDNILFAAELYLSSTFTQNNTWRRKTIHCSIEAKFGFAHSVEMHFAMI